VPAISQERVAMNPSDESPRTGLPRYPVSLVRAVAPWKRAANAATVLPRSQTLVTGWQPDREKLAAYRSLVGSAAEIPIAFPQLPIMALHIDLLSQWSFPVRALGLVHQGAVIEVLGELPVGGPWDVRAAVSGGRHVRAGLEFDVSGEVSVGGVVRWRSTSIYLSRSRAASGAEESDVLQLDSAGPWASEVAIHVPEGTGRAFGRVTGDINPIHLHAVPAKAFGFPQAIAHGWWTTGRAAAELGVDEAVSGRRLEIAFRRPIVLPSTPILCSRVQSSGGVEFAVFPGSPVPGGEEPARALVAGTVTG
jgi:acyl dehydratase